MDSWNILKLLLHCLLANTLVEVELTTAAQSPHSPPTSNIVPNNSDNKFVTDFINCTDIGFYRRNTNNTCYFYGEVGKYTWNDCKKECERRNASLTIPSTVQQEQDLIAYMKWRNYDLYKNEVWLGLHYKGNWVLVDNTIYKPELGMCRPKEPIASLVKMREEKYFVTQNASDADFYICQKEEEMTEEKIVRHKSPSKRIPLNHLILLSTITVLIPLSTLIALIALFKKRKQQVVPPTQADVKDLCDLKGMPLSENSGYVHLS